MLLSISEECDICVKSNCVSTPNCIVKCGEACENYSNGENIEECETCVYSICIYIPSCIETCGETCENSSNGGTQQSDRVLAQMLLAYLQKSGK